jgi:hypothetical protein
MPTILRSFAVLLALNLALCSVPAVADTPPAKKSPPAKKKSTSKSKPPAKTGTFEGMVVQVTGGGKKGSVAIKHSNGSITTFQITDKTRIEGLGVHSLNGVKKGQLVHVDHANKNAVKFQVLKHAERTPNLAGKAVFKGKVTKIVRDEFGDNGQIWVQDAKGVVKEFKAANETTVAAKKKDGKQVLHTLQGIAKGQNVHVRHAGVNATHIEIIE